MQTVVLSVCMNVQGAFNSLWNYMIEIPAWNDVVLSITEASGLSAGSLFLELICWISCQSGSLEGI